MITWNSLLNEAIIGYTFSVQHLAYAYSTAVTSLVQDLVAGISNPNQGVAAINEQESQNTALLTQFNNSAKTAADSLTDQINQTADTFDNDGSGSGSASGFRAERLIGDADINAFTAHGGGGTPINGEGNDSLTGAAGSNTLVDVTSGTPLTDDDVVGAYTFEISTLLGSLP